MKLFRNKRWSLIILNWLKVKTYKRVVHLMTVKPGKQILFIIQIAHFYNNQQTWRQRTLK